MFKQLLFVTVPIIFMINDLINVNEIYLYASSTSIEGRLAMCNSYLRETYRYPLIIFAIRLICIY